MPSGVRSLLVLLAWVAGVTAGLLLLFPLGFPNYDTIYALEWGRELAQGTSLDYGAALPPTPHPLADLFGLATEPLGQGAIDVTVAIAYLSLGLVAYLVYRLGSLWFDRPIGAVAALIVLTRAPYLANGLRAYIDLPYIALCLGALAIETQRRNAIASRREEGETTPEERGGPSGTGLGSEWLVLALLALAGLLRPEAWLFSIAYLTYLLLADGTKTSAMATLSSRRVGRLADGTIPSAMATLSSRRRRGWLGLAALALAGPILWVLFDWITAGSPTHSFTGTRETVETLERQTGPVDLVLYGPRRLGEVLQWPGMIGAAGGILLGVAFLRRRSTVGIAAAVLALAAFAVVGSGGLAIIPRYTMLAAAVLAIFCSLALLGWRLLEREHPWRRAWQGFAVVVALLFVVWGPNQYDLISRAETDLTNQGRIESDLEDLARSGAFEPLCLPISVPNHRAVPRLAFALEVQPSEIVSSTEQRQPDRGYFLAPADDFVVHNFILDPNDPARLDTPPPSGFRRVAANESWILYRRC